MNTETSSFQDLQALEMLQAVPLPAWMLSADRKHWVCNDLWLEAFPSGWDGWLTLLPSADQARVHRTLEAGLEGTEKFSLQRLFFPDSPGRAWKGVFSPVQSVGHLTGWLVVFSEDQQEELQTLRAVVNSVPLGISFTDRDLRFRMINPHMGQHTIYPVDAYLGRTFSEVYQGHYPEVEEEFRQVLHGGKSLFNVEYTATGADGVSRDLQRSHFAVRDDAGEILGVGSLLQDITDKKRAERQVQDSQRFAERIADTTPALIVIREVETLRLVYANAAMTEMLGYSLQETEDMNREQLFSSLHPDELEAAHAHAENIRNLPDGQSLEREYRVRHKDGSWHWFYARTTVFARDAAGQATMTLSVNLDITERKNIEQQLKESERRFQLVADQAPVMIFMASPDQSCTFLNRSWLDFTGRTPEQDLGFGWVQSIHPDDLEHCLQVTREAHEKRIPFDLEMRVRRFDGVWRWVVNRGIPRLTPEGEFRGFIGALIDIDDRKKAESALVQSEMLTRQLMEAQQRFLADASHELRTPLSSIQGNSELLMRYTHLPEDEKKEILTDIYRETARLGRLVSDLLQLARGDSGLGIRETEVPLHEVVLDVWRDLERMKPDHRFGLQQVDEITLMGDHDRLKQLALILLENAAKYTPKGGTIQMALMRAGEEAELCVSDTGVGISKEDLPRVFERFFRADAARSLGEDPGGTGLGLSIARWITEQHEGTITLESELGVGTTARVRLPIRALEA
ncbi:PAS domain-containing sensor histidine kinase [Deinococcus cellulosilyticus]|uniref:histidine kinase n=1 Tax=Deinococcus cellulosilyticus (strain DSM 18568 / NBRC 106333 / KACC 11606 / 5516J-15) TaxID=1223518 RepID=A0A511N8A1_DEIC1|nr:PAS domain-containing sensor histidine kinase [Deinococcus cellulosilyticus]GEM49072.1 hypothetical protein DC3_47070 [Deinococcus cellulosilyticus NBRC 106333 = KACC 11606]